MKSKHLLLLAFAVVCLLQLGVPVSMILGRENVLREGKEFRFITEPIDPYDPFRGKYVTLGFRDDFFETDTAQQWAMGQRVFVSLREDEEGFARISDITTEAPTEESDYLEAKVNYTNLTENGRQLVRISFPFDRFYMEETLAPAAETAYAEANWNATTLSWALVSVHEGEAVLKDVLIDGVPIREVAQQSLSR